ncbi:hypothetical protein BSL78_02063 [Apostichopus japonicus]|uniref:Uncharacterized protein n=1 Tax=Stichopus japonicus TaxID=307972 RepID=A0A2G8LLC7_STIJA|nr:hypothetical protein BSL78_02063 [Apostichopus japonicus]
MEMDHVGSYRCLVGNQIGDPAWSAVVTLSTSSAYGQTANIIMKLSMFIAVTVMIIGISMSVSYYRKKSLLDFTGIARVSYLRRSSQRTSNNYPVVTLSNTDFGPSTPCASRPLEPEDKDTSMFDPLYTQCHASTLKSDRTLSGFSDDSEFSGSTFQERLVG